jgi:hypothetical protein
LHDHLHRLQARVGNVGLHFQALDGCGAAAGVEQQVGPRIALDLAGPRAAGKRQFEPRDAQCVKAASGRCRTQLPFERVLSGDLDPSRQRAALELALVDGKPRPADRHFKRVGATAPGQGKVQ